MSRYAVFAGALLLDVIGAGAALLIASRSWQTVVYERRGPFPTITRDVIGRTVDAAPTALALVALAGVVAVLATRGSARRVVGVIIAVAGVGLIWRALVSSDDIDQVRVYRLLNLPIDSGFPAPTVETHPVWPILTAVCGALVAASGIVIAWRGHRWQVMSARYEAQPTQADESGKAAAILWTKLDRGEDPTD